MDISPDIFAYNFPLTLSHPLIIHTRTAISHLYPPATSYLYGIAFKFIYTIHHFHYVRPSQSLTR